jgi:dihydrolipoamide dehydrogenase
MNETKQSTQVAVIGGGPGGYTAAFMAADLGKQVALIDLDANPGGVCLYRGCIPSKALLHLSKVITEAREAAEWGVAFGEPKIDLDRIRAWKDSVVQKMTGGLGELCKRRDVKFIRGKASFLNATTLQIEQGDGQRLSLSFEFAILATGSRPITLPNQPQNHPDVLDSTGALELRGIPERLLVVGGGYIGMELGTVYATLGSQVTVVEMASHLLPGVDRDLASVLARRVKSQFDAILLNTKVVDIKEDAEGIRVRFEGADVSTPEQAFDKVLAAISRRPNTEGLGLENTAVEIDARGFVKVNAQRQTAEPTIYAIGDITGDPMLAHKAAHEGRVAARAIAGQKAVFEPRAIPAVVYTDPEIAWCGLTEAMAKQENRPVEIVRFPWGASGRATTLGRNDGVTKLILDPETEQVLGVGVAGPGAGELIAEGALAVEMAAVASDLEWTIHPHPTLSETLMEAAEAFLGHSTHIYRPKRK